MSNNTLAQYTPDQIKNPLLLAEHFSKSGYFKDASDVSKALVKIVAGQELGFGPMASMAGFHIIQGKPTLSANLMAAAIKRSGKYNFRVKTISDEICTIQFTENGEECGESTFTIDEAKKAGTQNLQKYPKNMLYARALSNGAKWFCPDVLNGSPIYTPEELGANVNEDGEVIEAPATTPEIEYITDSQLAKLLKEILPKLAKLQNITEEKLQSKLCKVWNIESLNNLTKAQATHTIKEAIAKIVNLENIESEKQDAKEDNEYNTGQTFDQHLNTDK